MSIGRRRSKVSRAQLRPSVTVSIKQGRQVRQRTRAALLALVGFSVLVECA